MRHETSQVPNTIFTNCWFCTSVSKPARQMFFFQVWRMSTGVVPASSIGNSPVILITIYKTSISLYQILLWNVDREMEIWWVIETLKLCLPVLLVEWLWIWGKSSWKCCHLLGFSYCCQSGSHGKALGYSADRTCLVLPFCCKWIIQLLNEFRSLCTWYKVSNT